MAAGGPNHGYTATSCGDAGLRDQLGHRQHFFGGWRSSGAFDAQAIPLQLLPPPTGRRANTGKRKSPNCSSCFFRLRRKLRKLASAKNSTLNGLAPPRGCCLLWLKLLPLGAPPRAAAS